MLADIFPWFPPVGLPETFWALVFQERNPKWLHALFWDAALKLWSVFNVAENRQGFRFFPNSCQIESPGDSPVNTALEPGGVQPAPGSWPDAGLCVSRRCINNKHKTRQYEAQSQKTHPQSLLPKKLFLSFLTSYIWPSVHLPELVFHKASWWIYVSLFPAHNAKDIRSRHFKFMPSSSKNLDTRIKLRTS